MHKQLPATFHTLVLAILCVCLGCGSSAGPRAACPAIEVSGAGTQTPLVTTADITGASVSQNQDQWGLEVGLTDAAAKRLEDYSAQHVGQTLPILVDGTVQGTPPKITGTIKAKRIMVGSFTHADAERMAAAIRDGCKR